MCFPLNPANLLPVSFTSPVTNTNVAAPGSFILTATATAPSSTVTQVDYYANGTMIGTATAAPYSYNWNTVPAGLYSLNNRGRTTNNFSCTN